MAELPFGGDSDADEDDEQFEDEDEDDVDVAAEAAAGGDAADGKSEWKLIMPPHHAGSVDWTAQNGDILCRLEAKKSDSCFTMNSRIGACFIVQVSVC